jgi:hypothetical protein
MKVKCINNTGKSLSIASIEAGNTIETQFQINIDDVYTVYGINVWRNTVGYLILDKWKTNPFWIPAELFEIVDNRLPPDWYYNFYNYKEDTWINAIWGYKELALSLDHYSKLIERYPEVLNIFKQRKKEIDQFHNNLA